MPREIALKEVTFDWPWPGEWESVEDVERFYKDRLYEALGDFTGMFTIAGWVIPDEVCDHIGGEDDSQIGSDQIHDGAVLNATLGEAVVEANNIADDAIEEAHVAAGAITSLATSLAAINATDGTLNTNSVGSLQIQTDAVTGAKILNGEITSLKTSLAAINATDGTLNTNSVGSLQIQTDAVAGEKILDDAIVAAKIAVAGLDGTTGNVAANHIVANMLQTDCVVASKIQAGAVTAKKISTYNFVLSEGTWTDDTPDASSVTWADVKVVYDGTESSITNGNTDKKFVYWESAFPTVFSTSDTIPALGNTDFIVAMNYSGSHALAWNSTLIDGGRIRTGTVTATNMVAGTITATELAAGCVTTDKILAGNVTANKISTYNFVLSAGTWADDSPDAGKVAWADVKVVYDGTESEITNGNTTDKFIYWESASPTVFSTSDSIPVIGGTDFIVAMNYDGSHALVWNSTMIDGGRIRTGTVTATNMVAGTITATELGAGCVTTEKLYADAVTAEKINVVGLDGESGRIMVTDQTDADTITDGINSHALTLIEAGKILIAGETDLSDWSHGVDATLIDGGQIYTQSITASQILAGCITADEIHAHTITSDKFYDTFGETFDGLTTEAIHGQGEYDWMGNWQSDCDSGCSAEVVVKSGDDKMLRLTDGSGSGLVTTTLTADEGHELIASFMTFNARMSATNKTGQVSLKQDDTLIAQMRFDDDSKIRLWAGGQSSILLDSYTADTWYSFKILWDCLGKGIAVYINNEFEGRLDLAESAGYINNLQFFTHFAQGGYTFDIDNIELNITYGSVSTTVSTHAGEHTVGGNDLVNHDDLTGFVGAEHLSLPATVASILTDHDKDAHDDLDIDADTLDTLHAASFALTTRKLDDFGAPDDNTDLNATTGYHGLLPKLTGSTAAWLRADGTWTAVAAGVHAGQHEIGGGDLIEHDNLTNYSPAEHKSLPNTIAQVLNDHNVAAHNALDITGLGTVSSGVWQGTPVANDYVAGINQNLLITSDVYFNTARAVRSAQVAGSSAFHMEAYSPDTGDANKEVSIKFRQLDQYTYQLRVRSGGFRFTAGNTDTLTTIKANAIYLGETYGLSSAGLVADNKVADSDKVDNEHVADIVTNARVKAHFPDLITNILSNHTTLIHDNLDINADRLDNYHASSFALISRKLDDFGTPDDNTDLNATTTRHGLLMKLTGSTALYLRADGTWGAPMPGIHAGQHHIGGGDLIDHDNLTNFVANEHISHASVQMIAGSGLSGGGYINANRTFNLGSLTANWDAGGYEIRARTFESDVATGTIPLVVASTTKCTNLNADLLDGLHMPALESSKYLTNNGSTLSWDNPSGSGLTTYFRTYRAAAQAFTTGTDTRVLWDTENYDIGGNATTIFTAPADGYYYLHASVMLNSLLSSTAVYIRLRKAGPTVLAQSRISGPASLQTVEVGTQLYLTSGTWVEVTIYHNRGSNINIQAGSTNSWFEGHRLDA